MRYVRYIGLAHIRQITAQDWRSVGINGDTVVWSARNGFSVPLDSLTEDQVTKAIDPDPEFVITGADEDFTPQPQTTDMTPSQLDQTVENPVDVLALANDGENPSTAVSEGSEAPGGAAPTGSSAAGSSTVGETVH